MGKIEDMRRLREQQVADGHRRQISPRRPEVVVAAPRAAAPIDVAEPEPVQPSRPTRSSKANAKASGGKKSASSDDEQGKCSGCGKMKPVNSGLIANHQKGLGKACAGSRMKPA